MIKNPVREFTIELQNFLLTLSAIWYSTPLTTAFLYTLMRVWGRLLVPCSLSGRLLRHQDNVLLFFLFRRSNVPRTFFWVHWVLIFLTHVVYLPAFREQWLRHLLRSLQFEQKESCHYLVSSTVRTCDEI